MTEEQIEWLKNLEPFKTSEDIPSIPRASTEEEQQLIIDCLVRCGAIPKKDLIKGQRYLGSCRNNSEAIWNGECFDYQRTKFGYTYWTTIKHFEDECYFDVFIPIKKLN